MTPWRETANGVELAVRVIPRGRRTGIDGISEGPNGPAVRVRVAAPPVEGAANEELIACVAKALGTAKGDVAIVAGAKSRTKTLRLSGRQVAERLAALLDR